MNVGRTLCVNDGCVVMGDSLCRALVLCNRRQSVLCTSKRSVCTRVTMMVV